MFSKSKQATSEASAGSTAPATIAAPSSAVPSIIDVNLRITGVLKSPGAIQIDGKVEGDINSTTVSVGESGEVQGTITAEIVSVSGSVVGSICAPSVNLTKTARIKGDIIHDRLAVESGAQIDGDIKRLGAAAAGSTTKSAR